MDISKEDQKDVKATPQPPPYLQLPPGLSAPETTITKELVVAVLSTTLHFTFGLDKDAIPARLNDGKTHHSAFMFQCKSAPTMSVKDYLSRIVNHSGISGESLILSMVHLSRFYRLLPTFPVNVLTIHRLLLVSVLISAKFFDDAFLNNACYAKIGGVETKEMNMLELEFLFLLDFKVFVTTEEYQQIYKELSTAALCYR